MSVFFSFFNFFDRFFGWHQNFFFFFYSYVIGELWSKICSRWHQYFWGLVNMGLLLFQRIRYKNKLKSEYLVFFSGFLKSVCKFLCKNFAHFAIRCKFYAIICLLKRFTPVYKWISIIVNSLLFHCVFRIWKVIALNITGITQSSSYFYLRLWNLMKIKVIT